MKIMKERRSRDKKRRSEHAESDDQVERSGSGTLLKRTGSSQVLRRTSSAHSVRRLGSAQVCNMYVRIYACMYVCGMAHGALLK
jgi:hypothetical protein